MAAPSFFHVDLANMNSTASDTSGETLEAAKACVRQEFLDRRASLKAAEPDAGNQIIDQILSLHQGQPFGKTAGYVAIGDELDIALAMSALHSRETMLCLPVNEAQDSALSFRAWEPGSALIGGPFGTRFPEASAEAVSPDVLLVPLVAFDCSGHRLGYGKGFYDITLAELRKDNSIAAYGVAYDGQEIESVPHDVFDARLDGIITPSRIILSDSESDEPA